MQGEDAGVIDMCRVQEQIGRLVIKTKFLLLTEQQANKSRGKVLEQEEKYRGEEEKEALWAVLRAPV